MESRRKEVGEGWNQIFSPRRPRVTEPNVSISLSNDPCLLPNQLYRLPWLIDGPRSHQRLAVRLLLIHARWMSEALSTDSLLAAFSDRRAFCGDSSYRALLQAFLVVEKKVEATITLFLFCFCRQCLAAYIDEREFARRLFVKGNISSYSFCWRESVGIFIFFLLA